MNLPIDARRAPFKPKYIESETPMFNRWIVLGRDQRDGTFWITDGTDDILCGLIHQQAQQMVEAREAFVDRVMEILHPTSTCPVHGVNS